MSASNPNSVPPPWAGRILAILFGLCALALAWDLIAPFAAPREVHHPLERWPIIYPIFGFVGIALLIQLAKLLRRAVKRPEDYYDAE